jgi:uncharacterized protein (TIGR02266 family)
MAEPTQKEPRGPTNLRIKFRSASLDQFIERYAVDVSRGGIFIRTREPLPVGTRLRLEFQLLDAAPLLAGEGTVVWIRENDPARGNVTPGMGVRFDKLSPDSQPTLERILAEKARLQQAGIATGGIANSGGGMAVRRATGAVAALDPASAPSSLARAGVSPAGVSSAGVPTASGPPPGAVAGDAPPASAPRHTAPMASVSTSETAPAPTAPRPPQVPSISKTSFFASPAGPSPASAGTGASARLRNTSGSPAVRPAPVPTALFEPPTADDIDKALEALQEEPASGAASLAPAPTTSADAHLAQPSSGTHTAPASAPGALAAPPLSEPLRYPAQNPAEDAFNDPTRVVDVVDELVGGAAARAPQSPDTEAAGSAETSADAPSAAGLDAAVAAQDDNARATSPPPPALRARPVRQAGKIENLVAPEKSRRFRAASSAYPTLQRRRISLSLAVVVIGGVLILGVLKLHWKERLFPAAPLPAPVAETPASTAPAPAPSSAAATAAAPGAPAPTAAPGAPAPTATPGAPAPSSTATTTAAPATPAPAATTTAVPAAPAPSSPPGAPATPAPAPTPTPAAAGGTPAVAKTKPPGQEKPTLAVSATPTASKDGATEAERHAKHGLHHRTPQTAEASSEAKPPAEGPTTATAVTEKSAADAKAGDKLSGKVTHENTAGEVAGGEGIAAGEAPGAPAATTPEPASPTLRVSSSPAGAEVIIDGTSLGYTPFSTKAVDPGSPHAITVKKTGYESTDRMISGLDWSRPHGNSPQSLKLNVKLRRAAASPPETPSSPKDNAGPADDSGGPYIKEIKPDKP